MTDALLLAAGILLVGAGLWEVFSAVLHYDHHGPLTTRVYRGVWVMVRAVALTVPDRHRDFVRSYGLPVMVVAAVSMWVALPMLGFSLIYYVGFNDGAFTLAPGLAPTYRTALYTSAITLSTLGYGDVTPTAFPYGLVAAGESLAGFAILTLTISYLISVYQVLRGLVMMTASLQHQSTREDEIAAILAPHFAGGEERGLDTRLNELHHALLGYFEGLHRYPIVYYFSSDRPYDFMPYSFLLIGELAGALRWGLPSGHPLTLDPWLVVVIEDYGEIVQYVRDQYGAAGTAEDRSRPPTLTSEEFKAELDAEPGSRDEGVRRFLDVVDTMRRILGEGHDWEADLYHRYVGWLEFARPASAFVRGVSRDLGGWVAILDPDHRRLFV